MSNDRLNLQIHRFETRCLLTLLAGHLVGVVDVHAQQFGDCLWRHPLPVRRQQPFNRGALTSPAVHNGRLVVEGARWTQDIVRRDLVVGPEESDETSL